MVEMIGVLKKEQEEKRVEDKEKAQKEEKKRKSKAKKGYNTHKNRACVDCKKRCIRIHRRVSSSSSSQKALLVQTPPSFFKIMIGYFSESMDIPPSFAKAILDLLDSNVFLEDTFGLRWRVRLCLRNGLLSFGHGWKNFVLDHAISVGEFLVFRQISRSVFAVQIFAPSACERLYLCEKNKRQSRKRKHRENTNSPGRQMVKISKNNVDICKRKHCDGPRIGLGQSNCNTSIHVDVNSGSPKAVSEFQCSAIVLQAQDVGIARSHVTTEDPTKDQDKAQEASKNEETGSEDDCMDKEARCNAVITGEPTCNATGPQPLESMAGINVSAKLEVLINLGVDANSSEACQDSSYSIVSNMVMVDTESLHSDIHRPMHLYTALGLEDEHTKTENREGSNLPTITNADANGSLAMMDLNEVSMDDIFLSADMYELINDGSDVCNPEAVSYELNMEGLPADGQTSSFNCCESGLQNLNSSIKSGNPSPPLETLSCAQNKEMSDAPRISTDVGNVPVHDIDINALPALGEENSVHETDAELPFTELDCCNKDKEIVLSSCEGIRLEEKEVDSSGKQCIKQDCPEQNALVIISDVPKPHEHPDIREKYRQVGHTSEGLQIKNAEPGLVLAVNHRKFCVAVPAANQTWLEFPSRLPVLPKTKKQGRKIVILKDPCMRLWPVLYQCTPRFNGFITGWQDISRENNLQEGDACEFELCTNSELSFQARASKP